MKQTISERHSINRVKKAEAFASRPHFNRQRAASLWIACRKWRGVWGVSRRAEEA